MRYRSPLPSLALSLMNPSTASATEQLRCVASRWLGVAKPLIAPGIAGCLCDFRGRSGRTGKERDGLLRRRVHVGGARKVYQSGQAVRGPAGRGSPELEFLRLRPQQSMAVRGPKWELRKQLAGSIVESAEVSPLIMPGRLNDSASRLKSKCRVSWESL